MNEEDISMKKKILVVCGIFSVVIITTYALLNKINRKTNKNTKEYEEEQFSTIELRDQKEKTVDDILDRHNYAASVIKESLNNINESTESVSDNTESFENMNKDLDNLL